MEVADNKGIFTLNGKYYIKSAATNTWAQYASLQDAKDAISLLGQVSNTGSALKNAASAFFDGKKAPSNSTPEPDTCLNIYTINGKYYARVKSTFGSTWKEFNSLDDAKRAYLNKKDIPLDTTCILGSKKTLSGNLRYGPQTETIETDNDNQIWKSTEYYIVKDGTFGRSLQKFKSLVEAQAFAKAARGGRRKTRGRGRGRKTRGRRS